MFSYCDGCGYYSFISVTKKYFISYFKKDIRLEFCKKCSLKRFPPLFEYMKSNHIKSERHLLGGK